MSGAIPPLPQYASMAWCSVKTQGKLYLLPLPFMRLSGNLIPFGSGKGKVKVKLSLCLTKHHAKEAYWGSGGIAPLIL
jgi:hypothetical protein